MTESNERTCENFDMPTVLLVPGFRMTHHRVTISFNQIARTIMFLTILGQQKQTWEQRPIRENDLRFTKQHI